MSLPNACAAILLLCGCGRVEFAPLTDGSIDAAPLASCGELVCLDPTFGTDGILLIDDGGFDNPSFASRGVAERPDGRLVVVGKTGVSGEHSFLAVSLLEHGGRDPSFGEGGTVRIVATSSAVANGVAVTPDDRVVVVGNAGDFAAILRLSPDGTLDPTFNGGTVKLVRPFAGTAQLNGPLVYPDGRIAAGGQAGQTIQGNFDLFATRVLEDGSDDPSFTAGVLDPLVGDDFGVLAAFGPNNSLYVAGQSFRGMVDFDCVVMRVADDGNVDASFGTRVSEIALEDRCFDAVPDATGVVAAGGVTDPLQDAFLLVRFTTDGALDASFGVEGIARADAGQGELLYGVVRLADGRLVAGGNILRNGELAAVIAVFAADGALVGIHDLPVARPSLVSALIVDRLGRIVAVGDVQQSTSRDILVARFAVGD